MSNSEHSEVDTTWGFSSSTNCIEGKVFDDISQCTSVILLSFEGKMTSWNTNSSKLS